MKVLVVNFLISLLIGFTAHARCTGMETTLTTETEIYELIPEKTSDRQVVILPPTGGMNYLDKRLAEGLCRKGHRVRVLDFPQGSGHTTDLGIHDFHSRQFLKTLNTYFESYPQPAVLVGSSLGGVYASMAYGLALRHSTDYPHLKWVTGTVLTVAGGPVAEILADSELDSAVEQRKLRFETGGYPTTESYLQALVANVKIDTIELAVPACRDRVLLFKSSDDTTVPTSTQEKLWKAWGSPESHELSTGHLLSILRVSLWWQNEISQFIHKLNEPSTCDYGTRSFSG